MVLAAGLEPAILEGSRLQTYCVYRFRHASELGCTATLTL